MSHRTFPTSHLFILFRPSRSVSTARSTASVATSLGSYESSYARTSVGGRPSRPSPARASSPPTSTDHSPMRGCTASTHRSPASGCLLAGSGSTTSGGCSQTRALMRRGGRTRPIGARGGHPKPGRSRTCAGADSYATARARAR